MSLLRLVGTLSAAAVLLGTGNVFAATQTEMTSVTIVEPKSQAKWGYAPATQTVEPGTWITWSNAGRDTHTVTAGDNVFDSGPLNPSEGFSWFFADPGTFPYVCTLHPWMTGTVIVGEGVALPPDSPPPDTEPPPSEDEPEPPSD